MLGDGNLQHAIVALGADTLRVRRVRENEHAMEAPQTPLTALTLRYTLSCGRDLSLFAPLAREGQHAVVQRDFYGAGVHAGEVDEQLESVLVLQDIDRGCPFRGGTAALGITEVAEDAIDLVLKLRPPPRVRIG
jgi:hypothetical protein